MKFKDKLISLFTYGVYDIECFDMDRLNERKSYIERYLSENDRLGSVGVYIYPECQSYQLSVECKPSCFSQLIRNMNLEKNGSGQNWC